MRTAPILLLPLQLIPNNTNTARPFLPDPAVLIFHLLFSKQLFCAVHVTGTVNSKRTAAAA